MTDFTGFPRPFICLVRHGETALARARRYNGRGDIELTDNGRDQARAMAPVLSPVAWDAIWCSPLQRARTTAALAGFDNPDIIPEMIEFDYGDFEGKTTREILDIRPDWDFWKHGCPHGETPDSAAERLAGPIRRLRELPGAVLAFSHSHAIRILTARWLGLPAESGSFFAYDPAHISIIGSHRGRPVIMLWNDGSHLSS